MGFCKRDFKLLSYSFWFRKYHSYHSSLGWTIDWGRVAGVRTGAYEEELSKACNIVFDEMNQKAREMSANGVVCMDIDYGTLGDTGSMLMVSVMV